MKTLKKTLCLVLAVVMAVGVLILPANATMDDYKNFDDTEKIDPDYEVAVATLTGMGIINGKGNGFCPQDGLNRAEAATLIATTLATPDGRALAVLGCSHPFTDVGGNWEWAAGNIGYLYEMGVVNGKSAASFEPGAPVTGYEMLTMLMLATGYTPKTPTASWTSKAIEYAREYDIFAKGLKDVIANPNKELTREEACQMIWQAIIHSADGKSTSVWVVSAKGQNDQTFTDRTDALLYMLAYNSGVNSADDKATMKQVVTNEGSISDEIYNMTETNTPDDFGRTLKQWVDKDDPRVVYSEFSSAAGKVYTSATNMSTALKAVGFKKDDKVTVTVIENGKTTVDKAVKTVDADKETLGSGAGTRVEVYNTSDGGVKSATVIVIDTYVHVLTKDDINKASGDTKANVSFEDAAGNSYYLETSEFTEGQVVIFTAVPGAEEKEFNIVDMNVANSFTGKVTATNKAGNYIKVDNAQKTVSAHAQAKGADSVEVGKTAGYAYNANTEYTYYEDSYGNIIYATTEQEAAPETDFLFVAIAKSRANKDPAGGDAILGTPGTGGTPAVARAVVIFPETGECKIVDIAMARKAGTSDFYYKNTRGALTDVKVVDSDEALEKGFHEFVQLADGTYAIVKDAAADTDVNLSRGNAVVANGKYATGSTHLVVSYFSDKDSKVTSNNRYDGYTTFPTLDTSKVTGYVYVDANDSGVVSRIYVVIYGEAAKAPTPVNYAVYKGLGEVDASGQHYQFYVNGEVKDYTLAEGAEELNVTAGGVYDLKLTDGQIVSAAAPADKTELKSQTVALSQDGFIVINSSVIYIDGSTVIVDKTDGYKVASGVKKDATVTVYYANKDGKDVAEFIIIEK